MNKVILREARKKGFVINSNIIQYESTKVELNTFLSEVHKMKYSHPIKDSIDECKKSLFSIDIQGGN